MKRALVTACVLVTLATPLNAQRATGSPPSSTPAPAAAPAAAAAATEQPALPGPPIRRIERAEAISTERLGAISGVRQLTDGRVLLNDGARRRLLMLDSSLNVVQVILDSLTEIENAYGTRSGTIMPYRGDSTLFIDPAALAMLILDDQGVTRRVRAVPRARDVGAVTNSPSGVPGIDAMGRLVYRIDARTTRPAVAPPRGMPFVVPVPDSAFVIGMHLDSRRTDTLGVVRVTSFLHSTRLEPEDYYSVNYIAHPLPLVDDWAVLSDGSLAFLRGIDYRVEFRAPDGTITSSEKLPFPWVRLSDEDKVRYADSINVVVVQNARDEYVSLVIAWSNLLNKPYPTSFTVHDGYVPPPGFPRDWILPKGVTFPRDYVGACPPGVLPPARGRVITVPAPAGQAGAEIRCTSSSYVTAYGVGYAPPPPQYRAPTLVKPRDLPDYRPPIGTRAIVADADTNLWVRTIPMRATPGGQVFDVINRKGELFDRIQLPAGYQLAGFGAGRVVYLSHRDATGLHLSRVRIK